MATLPTPASTFSAYGRRRHILQNTPSTQIPAPKPSAPPPQRPPQRTLWRAPNPPKLPPALLNRLSPVLSFTETTFLQSSLLTVLTILVTVLLTPLFTAPAQLFNTCSTFPPSPSHPISSALIKAFALPLVAIALTTRHLLLRTSDATQIIGAPLTAILQTTFTNFLAFGSLPPHQYLFAACTPLESPIFPKWPDLLPQVFHSAMAACLHHLLLRHTPPKPLAGSLYRGATLTFIPTILAALPLLTIPIGALFYGRKIALRSLGAVVAALVTTLSVLVGWSIQSVLHDTRVNVVTPEVESQKLSEYLRDEAAPNVVIPSLRAVTISNEVLHYFIGYTDASGSSWRSLLAHCLHPVNSVRTALQTRVTPTLFASTAPLWNVVLPPEDVSLAITSTESLARVYEECGKADTYGVVHRTLPYALAELLRCKLETAGYLSSPDNEAGEGIRWAIGIRSTREMVVAVDDALTVCVYRIVGAFRGHLLTYLRGGEAEWDRGLNNVLQAFLDYQVP